MRLAKIQINSQVISGETYQCSIHSQTSFAQVSYIQSANNLICGARWVNDSTNLKTAAHQAYSYLQNLSKHTSLRCQVATTGQSTGHRPQLVVFNGDDTEPTS